MTKLLSALVGVGVALVAPSLALASNNTKITEVRVDAAAATIAITGRDLSHFGHFTVTLGEIGDISTLCALGAKGIVCDFSPVGGLPPDGHYRLTVLPGPDDSKSGDVGDEGDDFDLTISKPGPLGGPPVVFELYTRSATVTAPPPFYSFELTATALCDPGDPVVGGGFTEALAASGNYSRNMTSAPNATGTGWVALVERLFFPGSTLTAWARCADMTPH